MFSSQALKQVLCFHYWHVRLNWLKFDCKPKIVRNSTNHSHSSNTSQAITWCFYAQSSLISILFVVAQTWQTTQITGKPNKWHVVLCRALSESITEKASSDSIVVWRRWFVGMWAFLCRVQSLFYFFNLLNCSDVFPYGIYMLTFEYMHQFLDDFDWMKAKRKQYKCNSHMGSACTKNNCYVEMFISTTSGAIAGVMSWILVIPFDVMKTITQAQSDPDKQRNMRSLLKSKRNVSVSVHFRFWFLNWKWFYSVTETWMANIFSRQLDAHCAIDTGQCGYIFGWKQFYFINFSRQNSNFVPTFFVGYKYALTKCQLISDSIPAYQKGENELRNKFRTKPHDKPKLS